MTFSRYSEYVAAVADRNMVVLSAAFAALAVVVLFAALGRWPRVRIVAVWTLGVGGYYALLAAVYILWIAGA